MESLTSKNKNVQYLLCVIDVLIKMGMGYENMKNVKRLNSS